MKLKILFFTSLLTLFASHLSAQINFKTEYLGTSSYWLDNGDDSRERIGNTKGSAIVYEGNINLPFSIKMNEKEKPIIWGTTLGASYTSLKNKNFTDYLVISEIMNLGWGLYHIRPFKERWFMMIGLGAGIYSPSSKFSDIRARHIMGSGALLFIYQLNPNLKIGGGIAINSTFGYPMVFPGFYLDWNRQGKFDVKISMANGLEMKMGMDVNKFLDLSIIAEMNGQSAFLKKEGKDVIFTHQYIVSGIRSEIKLGKHISIPVTIGVNAFRPAFFTNRTLKAVFKSDNDYYFQASFYMAAGLSIGF